MIRLLLQLAAMLLLHAAVPAQGAVTITFWSHEFGNSFPHAFFTLRGIPDAGGPPVDRDWGFSPDTIGPAILFGPVKGVIEQAKPAYLRGSDAQFSLVLTDAQYAAILALIDEWSPAGDPTYRLETRNCVHFVQEAARRAGLSVVDFPRLMKKPRSYLKAVAAANPQVTVIDRHGKQYLATLPPIMMPTLPVPTSATALTPPSSPHPSTGSRR
ncbi:hypothetical protein [Sphingomonas sp.]|uniref:hypothetical protein n=1 Tax=Sphingomonas sp. TaxID=28214 RepID=UPI0035C81F4A